jgi:hypothetical protein
MSKRSFTNEFKSIHISSDSKASGNVAQVGTSFAISSFCEIASGGDEYDKGFRNLAAGSPVRILWALPSGWQSRPRPHNIAGNCSVANGTNSGWSVCFALNPERIGRARRALPIGLMVAMYRVSGALRRVRAQICFEVPEMRLQHGKGIWFSLGRGRC